MTTTDSLLEKAYENRYQQIATDIQKLKNVGRKIGMTDQQIEADLLLATDDPGFVKRHAQIMSGGK